MAWEVEASDEFKGWYESLDEAERASVAENVDMLEEYGPALGRPYADTIRESRYPNMKGATSREALPHPVCLRSATACVLDSGWRQNRGRELVCGSNSQGRSYLCSAP
jgi:hypothetical protein